ncbi:hypothetical protein GT347_15825 [Xylophilus rhododendri]|uniref:Uncharacterized protein n=1 Tax=Xylophilus rhododendri TaxID=2697032 RepID=A0A857J978_9BURK|nr:hypothetical protein [Xylophilus rhododendri]QHI99315.1 hypothetical protein GT347_15825 [Xylophilus rhododendri]
MHFPPTAPGPITKPRTLPPPRYEQQAPEMKSAIARCNLQWQLFEPESGGIACFAQCNSTLARELALEVAASAVIHALGTANDAAQFQAALDTVASAPACYLPECWKAAWNALEALSAPAKAAELQAMFTAVLDRLPAHPGLRLQQLRRAARFGSQCSRGTSAWSVESTARLLQLWAEQADMPPRVWRQLLQMQQRTQYRQVATDFERILRTPGLTAEQQDQLQLQMHCMCRRLPPRSCRRCSPRWSVSPTRACAWTCWDCCTWSC